MQARVPVPKSETFTSSVLVRRRFMGFKSSLAKQRSLSLNFQAAKSP